MTRSIDLDRFTAVVQAGLTRPLLELLEGSTNDVAVFAARVSAGLTEALAANNLELLDERMEQFPVIGEELRVRAAAASWDAVRNLVSGVFGILLELITSAEISLQTRQGAIEDSASGGDS